MANLFVNLPLPVLNGPGANVATDTMGRDKTIVVSGTFPGAVVTVEVSVDGGVNFAPIAIFQSGSNKAVIPVAAQWMRVNVSGRKGSVPFSANIDVGANDNGAQFIALAFPALNGAGPSSMASTLGSFATFIVAGVFPGASVQVQASEDGVDWAPCVQFSGAGGIQSKPVIAEFYRVFVSGRTASLPFTGTASVGAIDDPITVMLPGAVIFDDFVPADQVNIRSDRASNQSPIDNTLIQITNLGSQDLNINPAAVGVIAQGGTIGGGDDNSAEGDYATVAGGSGNRARGSNSAIGGGELNIAFNHHATVAGGGSNDAHNLYSTVGGGDSNIAQADYVTISGGQSNDVDADYGTVGGGRANIIVGGATSYSTIGGGHDNKVNAASGSAAVIAGGISNTTQAGAVSQPVISGGEYNEVHASWSSIPGGLGVKTTLPSQFAVGAGGFTVVFPPVAGEAQTSHMVMRGSTPGVGITEAVELLAGDGGATVPVTPLTLEDGKAYAFKVTLVAGGVQAGPTRVSRSIEIEFNARRDGGTSVITASGAGAAYGDAATATWTLVATIGAAPDRVVLTFDTGVGAASACNAVARVEFTEAVF